MILRSNFCAAQPEFRQRWLAPKVGELFDDVRHAGGRSGRRRRLAHALGLLSLCVLLTSCPGVRPPGALGVLHRVVAPAQVLGNFFVVEATVDGRGPFRFLIDTGSSISLVSHRVADARPSETGAVVVRSADGGVASLPRVTLSRATIGAATFVDVPAAVHEFREVSDQLGVQVDGLLGLPVFRDVLLTLDYPAGQLVLDPRGALDAARDSTLHASYGAGVPLTMVRIGDRETAALIDSGSDGGLAINAHEGVAFAAPLRAGAMRATLAGDYQQRVGRLTSDLQIGGHALRRPVVEVTDRLPSVGGDILKNFSVTFDQRGEQLVLRRSADAAPLQSAPQRSVGLSFLRGSSAWQVATVIADTPAAALPIRDGDVCVRINGEPVAAWPIDRFNALLRSAASVTFTLREGADKERELLLPVVDLVP